MNGLFTDLYQLTMTQSYFKQNRNDKAVFEVFIRSLPKQWQYFVVTGVDEAITKITNYAFDKEDLEYLKSTEMFEDDFLNYLSTFKFKGNVYSVKEGTIMFPNEPIMQIEGNMIETQLLESFVLNTINFQTLIASKASRVVNAAKGKAIIDFGLRRAQGEEAAMKAARASYLAGCVGTSNVAAGLKYNIPISGTMAHSFIMQASSEYDAFLSYAKQYKESSILLVDTYNTEEGIKNAIKVALEMLKKNIEIKGIRIDSGDLVLYSKLARKMFKENNVSFMKVFVSNDLNEYKIAELELKGAVDGYGVGTEMITAKPVAAISGVYKLVVYNNKPVQKNSEGKHTIPGVKQILRFYKNGTFIGDTVKYNDTASNQNRNFKFTLPTEASRIELLLEEKVVGGESNYLTDDVKTREYIKQQLESMSYIRDIEVNADTVKTDLVKFEEIN